MSNSPPEPRSAEAQLLDLKDAALAASARRDASFYSTYLSADALAITPHGTAGVDDVVAAAAQGGFRSLGVEDTTVKMITDDVGLVTYRAEFGLAGSEPHTMLVSTLYRREPDGWKGVLYQQTPLAQ